MIVFINARMLRNMFILRKWDDYLANNIKNYLTILNIFNYLTNFITKSVTLNLLFKIYQA